MWIAAIAVIVACVTLAFQILHNRISVRPHIIISRHTEKSNRGLVKIAYLQNVGLGPAIIENMRYIVDGEKYTVKGDIIPELAEKLIKKELPYEILQHQQIGNGFALIPHTPYILIKILIPTNESNVQAVKTSGILDVYDESITKKFDRVDIEIDYKSIYGQKFSFKSE